MGYELPEKDLAHIRAVLNHLEHSTDDPLPNEPENGMSLGYWRARIRAVLAIPLLPIYLQMQSRELLVRLDRLASRRARCMASP